MPSNLLRDRVEVRPLPVRRSTYLAGAAAGVHRWFRLTPSFGPDLVRHLLGAMETPPGATVLDPFAGAGTTLIEARLEGHAAFGFEINPLLHFVCEASVDWTLDAGFAAVALDLVGGRLREMRAGGRSLEALGLRAPPIHNVHRWWRPDVLGDLLRLRQAIDEVGAAAERLRRFLRLALAGVLVPDLTNVTLGRLQLHFIDRSADEIDVWRTFERHARAMIADLAAVAPLREKGSARAFHADATAPPATLGLPRIDRVVSSPPYPNRYSYVWNTRPHLYLLGFFTGGGQAGALDLQTIGGTWGAATTRLQKGVVEPGCEAVRAVAGPLVNQVRARDNLMANYLAKYFNLLARQIVAQDALLGPGARLAYVVGCSRLKGVFVETDVLLGRLFEALDRGYRVERIERFRKRHGGKELHEAAVLVRKEG